MALLPALLLAGGAAGAEKKPPPEAGLGKKRTVGPDASLAGSLEAAKARKPEERGPALEFEIFRYRIELEVSGKRREEIVDLTKLIRLGGAPREMPGWLFRLGELYWEESQYFFFEANRKDDELIRLGDKATQADRERIRREKKNLEERSRSYQGEAITQYKDIVRRYPKYERLDEVLFFLGENLYRQGRHEEALAAYKILVTRYEKSRYVPDAWMAFGEYYFNVADRSKRDQNLRNALKAYQKAASYTESSVYGYAMYKQAWVFYNMARWAEALDLFRAVIFFGDLPTSTLAPEKKLALVREARKDYVRTYSHVGAPEAARDEFKRVGGDKGWFDMLKSLAGLYYDEGKDREAILTYHQLIQERPLSPESPLFQARIVTCAGRMGRKELAVQQARVFVKMLRDIDASKTVTDEKGKKQLEEARVAAENTLRTLAVQYHNEYRKARDEPVAGLAAEVYEYYLSIFPDTHYAYEMRFFFAELLFALEKYQRAGDEYTVLAVADAKAVDQKRKPGKYFADALENSVYAYDLVAKKLDETEKRPASDPKQRQAIPKPRQQLLDACLRYVKYAPRGDKAVEVTYKAANIYYRYNWFGEATDLFTRVALDHPRHEVAGYAANLVLDAYNLLGDWRNVLGWAKRFYGNRDLIAAHPQLKDDLAKVIEQSSFKVIDEYEKAGEHRKAAEAYLAFVREWPQSRHAPTALFNASVAFAGARMLDRAVEARERLAAAYPADPLAAKCVYMNGADYEAVADFERAAGLYERYFEAWRKSRAAAPAARAQRGRKGKAAPAPAPAPGAYEESKAQDALYNAGVFREGLRDFRRAEADRQAWLATWPDAKEAPRIFLSLADLYAKEKSSAKELRQLEDYQRRFVKDPTEWLVIQQRIAKVMERAGNAAGARRAYEQGLAYYRARKGQVGERGLPVVAWAMVLALEPEFERYDRITFDVKPKLLKSQVEVKAKRLAELQKSYTEVVNLKQAEAAVCALYRIGLGYQRFAQALTGAPVPKELKALKRQDVIDEYRSQMEQFAKAPEAKAVEGLEYAMTKAREYGVSNDCSRRAAELLLKHKPELYAPPQEAVPPLLAAVPDSRAGHGLLLALKPAAAVAPAPAELALPPLQARRDAPAAQAAARDADLKELPPPRRVEPPRRGAPAKAERRDAPVRVEHDEDDEDLLK
ncbi:MAG TPA: tetratricopeptide repeat protein [Anaeromyxobacteraceae bacterium]|nr:tetratricopeptide repeat protein [Anaeromyxobacteraceae bacterium]